MRTNPVPTFAKLQQVALRAARAAGRIHLRRLSRIEVTRKTNAIDLVTEADQESEQAVIRTLSRAFPDHAILAEESGADGSNLQWCSTRSSANCSWRRVAAARGSTGGRSM
jgi:fructose-1,6-bisphosphatase/inositol monophosphatase family enzyme